MIQAAIKEITKSYGDRLLFSDVTFGINEGDKIGLVAKNGTGKSTLLRIIAGVETPDSGTVTMRTGLKVGFLEQLPVMTEGSTPIDVCMTVKPDVHTDEAEHRLRAERLLTQLGITDINAPVENLSGGQRKRVAIAKVLLSEPDLLILDEPTNHLDIDVIEWLESWLTRSRATILMVTHDRYFLDRVCNTVIEIDRGEIFTYQNANYDTYLRRRAERIEALVGELAKVRNTLRREQEWMRRQPQARAGKAKYRIDQYYDLKERSRANYTERNVELNTGAGYVGSKIFEADGISKCYGDKVILSDFNYVFARYEKLGIVGRNGVGKSTFVKMLQGLVAPDSGHWDIGTTVRFGYYSQDGIDFRPDDRVADAVKRIADDVVIDGAHISPTTLLSRFLFTPADQQKRISLLSGGERSRLHLATVLMRQPNFLILDEPTNDLDLVTLGILEEYLSTWKGCLIVISHDRSFLDRVVDHLFVFEGDGVIRDFPGTYSEYRAYEAERKAAETANAQPSTDTRQKRQRAPKLSFKERRELEELTKTIESTETEIRELSDMFASGNVTGDIAELSARYASLKEQLDEMELRWLELSEKES